MPVSNEVLFELIQQLRMEMNARFTGLQSHVDAGLVDVGKRIDRINGTVRKNETEIVRLQGRCTANSDNWEKFWKYGLGVVVTAIVAAVLAGILKQVGVI